MLVACRLAGLSALETCYALVRVGAQCRGHVAARPPSRIANRPAASRSVAGEEADRLGRPFSCGVGLDPTVF